MSLKIRLQRAGAKKKPFYRIVVANSTAPRDGKFIEKVGTYNPNLDKSSTERVQLNQERITYWLKTGATPTERVALFIATQGFANDNAAVKEILNKREKTIKVKQAEAKKKAEEEAKKKAAEEAKAAAEAKAAEEAEKAAAAEAAKTEEAPAA